MPTTTTAAPYLIFNGTRAVASAPPVAETLLDKIDSFNLTRSFMGHIGSMEARTSIAKNPLVVPGLSIAARRGVVGIQAKALLNGATKTLFTGVFDAGEYVFEADDLDIKARDIGAVMMERTIAPKSSYANESANGFIQRTIAEAGLKTAYIDPILDRQRNPLKVGSFFNQATIHSVLRESTWGLLQKLAKLTGNVVYVNGDGTVYFGPRSTQFTLGTSVKNYVFSSNGTGNLKTLKIIHQPYKHAAFVQQVFSHERSQGSRVQQVVAYLNSDVAKDAQLQPGLLIGITEPQLAESVQDLPSYNIFTEGKQSDQALAQALAQARETAGQEIVIHGMSLANEGPEVGDPVTFQGTSLPFVDGRPFTVSSITLVFDMEAQGFVSNFIAWVTDPEITGTELS